MVFELPIMYWSEVFIRRLGVAGMVIVGQAAWIVRAIGVSQMPQIYGLVLICLLFASFSFSTRWCHQPGQ